MPLFRKKNQPTLSEPKVEPKDFAVPNGTAIEAQGLYFYVRGGKKYRIPSERVLLSQRYPRVISVTVACANRIPNAKAKIGFREGQIIRDMSNNALYLISDNKRLWITTPDFVKVYGVTDMDILLVSHEEALLHQEGGNIDGL